METGTGNFVFADSAGFHRSLFFHRALSRVARHLLSVLRGYFARTKRSEPGAARGVGCVLAIPAAGSAFHLRFKNLARTAILYRNAHRVFPHVDVFRRDIQRSLVDGVAIAPLLSRGASEGSLTRHLELQLSNASYRAAAAAETVELSRTNTLKIPCSKSTLSASKSNNSSRSIRKTDPGSTVLTRHPICSPPSVSYVPTMSPGRAETASPPDGESSANWPLSTM